FRKEAPRAIAGPAMAPINGPSRALARRFSKITGAVVESILREPMRETALRPAMAPISSGEGRAARQRWLRPSPPTSLPDPSPAIAAADKEKPVASVRPLKPVEVTSRQREADQVAEAPSLLVT